MALNELVSGDQHVDGVALSSDLPLKGERGAHATLAANQNHTCVSTRAAAPEKGWCWGGEGGGGGGGAGGGGGRRGPRAPP
eukprot:COSAG06_NODE_14072_length_1192_cov_1.876487_2_plen_80_part_01